MDALNHILLLLLTLGASCCHGHECDTGCAPTWDIPEPSMRTIDRLRGEDVDFRCRAFGIPRPSVTWSKGGNPLTSSFDEKVTVGYNSLRLVDLQPQDSGSYTCYVVNQFGSVEWSMYLTVYEKGSEEIDGPTNKTAFVNQTAKFWCRIDVADIDVQVTWIHDVMNEAMLRHEVLVVKHSVYRSYDQLLLHRLTIADSGRYACVVNTTLTSIERSAWLTVINNPDEGPRIGGSKDEGESVSFTPFGHFLQNTGIVVASLLGVALCVVLTISAVNFYRDWRKLKVENRGVIRLQEEPVLDEELL